MEIGRDGITVEQRTRGRKSAVLGLEFGEKVLYKRKTETNYMEKILPRWEYGLFLGIKQSSGELLIMGPNGLKVVRSARRIPSEERWDPKCLDWVRLVPWNLGDGDKKADGDIPVAVKSGPARELTSEETDSLKTRTTRSYPEFKIMKEHCEKFGYTHGCPGCSSRIRGLHRQPHNPTCRERFGNLLQTEAFLANEDAQTAGRKRRPEDDGDPVEKRARPDDTAASSSSALDGIQDEAMPSRDGVGTGIKRQSDMTLEELEASIGQIVCGDDGEEVSAWDDANKNIELPIKDVKEARAEEMGHMKGKVFKIATKSECYERTGKAPASTKWVDTDKSHGQGKMVVRSRWVARDFKTRGERDREDLFCATPPIELLRFLASRQATRSWSGRVRKSMFLDVRKAHLVPKCEQDVYVELPPEAGAADDECGKLLYWLYGCRPAGQAWEDHYSRVLVDAGFTRGVSSPVIFFHLSRELWCVVHGDDFMFTGFEEDLDYALGVMEKEYEIKNRGTLGPDNSDVQEIDILGRILGYHSWGISWKADPRHKKMILEHFGFNDNTKSLRKNGYKDEIQEEPDKDVKLQREEESGFRAIAARSNYMAVDVPNVQYPTKEICRDMSKPSVAAYERVKKLARYMSSYEEVSFHYEWQNEHEATNLKCFTDSDWAGCRKSRKSTSGGAIMLGKHCLRTWSTTQPVHALSVAEAEYYAIIEGATRCLGLQTMLKEMGVEVGVLVVNTDSASAKSYASKRGLGKMRHIEVKDLWLQEAVCRGRVKLFKIDGEKNPADLFTKYLSDVDIERHLKALNVHIELVAR